MTWGVAYEICGEEHIQHAVEHLYARENAKGGYQTMMLPFHPRNKSTESTKESSTRSQHFRISRKSSNHSNSYSRTLGIDAESDSDSESSLDDDNDDEDEDSDETSTASGNESHEESFVTSATFPRFAEVTSELNVMSFTATSESDQWLGDVDLPTMAKQVSF